MSLLAARVYFGRSLSLVPPGSLVFFPLEASRFHCGLAGVVAFRKGQAPPVFQVFGLEGLLNPVTASDHTSHGEVKDLGPLYLGGTEHLERFHEAARSLNSDQGFVRLLNAPEERDLVRSVAKALGRCVDGETGWLKSRLGIFPPAAIDTAAGRIEQVKDIAWCLEKEVAENVDRVEALMHFEAGHGQDGAIPLFRKINAVLNSIDRLEVRGRDSAGLSIMFILDGPSLSAFHEQVNQKGLAGELASRSRSETLTNRAVQIRSMGSAPAGASITLVYKVAAEIGRLGDNIRFIREQVRTDPLLKVLSRIGFSHHSVLSHTRWASVGAITEPNCHPVDNQSTDGGQCRKGVIHVCLNGDIDNYLNLKERLTERGLRPHEEITSDTKIIPLQIESHLGSVSDVAEAFRLALNDFEGSHAIVMHTDLAPGKLFLAQRGSGQAIFVGLARDHYMPVSEVYGFVEETNRYIKLDGEREIQGKNGPVRGQIFILAPEGAGGLEGIRACYYDGTPIALSEEMVKTTRITSRDIDRQEFPHYFLKEISESPNSVEKTLQGRWRRHPHAPETLEAQLGPDAFPEAVRSAFLSKTIRRIYFVGQGTAGIAAQGCADLTAYYLNDPGLQVQAMKASELSGFKIDAGKADMADALVVAISQSGTTTDTNRAVDLVREKGAWTLAIVNRRDSDLTFKVHGVVYTSSGRDIEMSVASTKAFYAQIVAGAILGLFMAQTAGRRDATFISGELRELIALPAAMRAVLEDQSRIAESARTLAPRTTYWAVVGSGPNKAAADEIRIKLSELCYKTISSDYVEDKKHIDLSAEPLIIVCAAGSGGTVIGDIVKDTAIFKAHKALPVVIADAGEERFSPYAEKVLLVPSVPGHLAPILNTLAGHLWGYYAALSINEGSRFLFDFQARLHEMVEAFLEKGLDIYEIFLEKSFREAVAAFYRAFHHKRVQGAFPVTMGMDMAADLTLLCKYLSGRLPVSDFELDFDKKGTALNMLETFYERLGRAINAMARPVDAIKHQAKTVTVGTSRIQDKSEGLLFDALAAHGMQAANLTPQNILVLRNLQTVVGGIKGSILYKIDGLTLLGEVSDDTAIRIVEKRGVLAELPSRVETDTALKGTKRIIVRKGDVYIGKGRKDDRSILIVPILSAEKTERALISHLLLLNIEFAENVPMEKRMKALGGKGEHIKNILQENNVAWEDGLLERVPLEVLFGRSAEKIAEGILKGQF